MNIEDMIMPFIILNGKIAGTTKFRMSGNFNSEVYAGKMNK